MIGAGAVGLLCAVAARLEGCTRVIMADIVGARVDFAVQHKFADAGFVVPAKRSADPEEQLQISKEMAQSLEKVKSPDGTAAGKSDYTFECTGVQSCVQASVYVRIRIFVSSHNRALTRDRLRKQAAKLF